MSRSSRSGFGWWVAWVLTLGIVWPDSGLAAVRPLSIQKEAGGTNAVVGFQKDILPMFQANCLPCHNQTRAKAGLNLETPAALLRGGDTGPGAVPGKPAESLVLKSAAHQVEDLVMPPAGNKSNARDLTPEELGVLWRWIEQGAKADRAVVVEPAWKPISPEWNASFAVALDSEGATVAVARANRVSVIELATGKTIGRLEDPTLNGASQRDVVGAMAFSPDDQWLATAGFREVRLWQRRPVTVEPRVASAPKAPWVAAAFSPEGTALATVNASGILEIRSDPLTRVLGTWSLKGNANAPVASSSAVRLTWSPDGRWLSVVSGRDAWSVSRMKPGPSLSKARALPAEPTGVGWMPGGDSWVITYGSSHAPQRWRQTAEGSEPGPGALEDIPEIPADSRVLTTEAATKGSLWLSGASGGLVTWPQGPQGLLRGAGPVRSLLWDRSGSNGVVVLSTGGAQTLSRNLSQTQSITLAGDPRLSLEALREEAELGRSRLELALAGTRIGEARSAVTQAQTALAKAREKRDLAAKTLTEREKDWSAQNALAAAATRDRDSAASELTRIQSEAKAAGEELQKALTAAKATPETALKSLDDVAAKAESAGRRKAALERAEAEIPPRRKKAEDQLAEAQKKAGELKGPLDKARIAAEGAGQDVVLAEKAVADANASVATAQAEEQAAQGRIARSETRLKTVQAERDRSKTRPFEVAALSPSGDSLITVGADGLWTRWHPGTGRASAPFAVGQGMPLALVALNDEEFLAAFPEGVSRIQTARPWFLRQTLAGSATAPAFADRINALAFSPDGSLLATGGGEPSRSGELKLWKLPEGTLAHDLGAVHSDAVTAVAFSPRGERIASAGADRFARITPLQTPAARLHLEGHTHHVIAVAWAPDGSVLATGGAEGMVKLWNPRTGERRKNIEGFGKEVTGLQPAGGLLRFVAVSGSGKGRVFKSDGETVRDLATVPEYLQALSVSRDGRWVVGADDRGIVRLWDAESGQLRRTWEP